MVVDVVETVNMVNDSCGTTYKRPRAAVGLPTVEMTTKQFHEETTWKIDSSKGNVPCVVPWVIEPKENDARSLFTTPLTSSKKVTDTAAVESAYVKRKLIEVDVRAAVPKAGAMLSLPSISNTRTALEIENDSHLRSNRPGSLSWKKSKPEETASMVSVVTENVAFK